MSYRREICEMLAKHCDLRQSVILEIGSDAALDGARILSELGSKLVIASNRGADWPAGSVPDRTMAAVGVDGRQMRMGADTFDIVLGTAVLEHISDLPSAFAEFRRVLKPGGILCIHGGPLWNCGKGHHVWVDVEGKSYRFNDESLNPVPSWGHLLYEEPELCEILSKSRHIPETHAVAISKWIFNTDELSRVTYNTIINIARGSGFEIVDKKEIIWSIPSAEVIAAILRRNRYNGDERFDVSDIRLILRKQS